jgi:antirestriction protein ArdC
MTTEDDERQAKVAALHATLSEEVEALMTSDGWAAMLAAAARFTHYSLNNTLLLMAQTYRRGMPTDSRVAGFNTWRNLGRIVRKGEKGLAIFAPCTYRPKGDAEEGTEAAPTTGAKVIRGFRVAYVFAESQTDGDEIPDIRPNLEPGDAPAGLWDALADLVATEGFTLERGDVGRAFGMTDPKRKTVTVRDGVSDAQAVKTLAHELAHVLLHCDPSYNYGECRGAAEVEAESIAYVVAAANGLNTTTYSAPYVAGWAGGDPKRVKQAAERVVSTSGQILARLESRVLVAA